MARGRDFKKPVRRNSLNDRAVAAAAGRINRTAGGKRDAFDSKLPGDVRYNGAGLDWMRQVLDNLKVCRVTSLMRFISLMRVDGVSRRDGFNALI
jgi:hypothetical protein